MTMEGGAAASDRRGILKTIAWVWLIVLAAASLVGVLVPRARHGAANAPEAAAAVADLADTDDGAQTPSVQQEPEQHDPVALIVAKQDERPAIRDPDEYAKASQESYQRGLLDGYQRGAVDGYQRGDQAGYQRGIEEGYRRGYLDGRQVGNWGGSLSGYQKGTLDGYSIGYEQARQK